MKTSRSILVAAVLIAALFVSAVVIFAQASYGSFGDGRINGDVDLGGLAIYCVDQNGSANRNSFQSGAITVWGAGGDKFIDLTAAQLRGQQATTTNTHVVTDPSQITKFPVLLATADTPNGKIWFWLAGPNDFFQLQGTDTTGKFYTYTWQDCALGYIATGGGPYNSAAAAVMVSPTPRPTVLFLPTIQSTLPAFPTPAATTNP